MTWLLSRANSLYDWLDARWEGAATRRTVASILIFSFFAALLVIEVNRQGWMPAPFDARLPVNHFYAVDVAFTLFLVVEVVGLVFGLATSVAEALGKQFEIFSLILLRQSFKELIHFSEPIQWTLDSDEAREAVQLVMVDAIGALLIFAVIGYYYRMQEHRRITDTEEEQKRFVATKKGLSVTLLVTLSGLGLYTVVDFVVFGEAIAFFDTFYTVLIFSDVLVVLISLRYSATYHVVFRNSGFAAATVMIRLALAGPRYVDAGIGLVAALFAVGLTAAYNSVVPAVKKSQRLNAERKRLDDEGAPPGTGSLGHGGPDVGDVVQSEEKSGETTADKAQDGPRDRAL